MHTGKCTGVPRPVQRQCNASTQTLVTGPVIAVLVSTGYDAAMSGFTALFSSLTSCSPGVCVVNTDNGIGATAGALRIPKRFS